LSPAYSRFPAVLDRRSRPSSLSRTAAGVQPSGGSVFARDQSMTGRWNVPGNEPRRRAVFPKLPCAAGDGPVGVAHFFKGRSCADLRYSGGRWSAVPHCPKSRKRRRNRQAQEEMTLTDRLDGQVALVTGGGRNIG